MGTEKVNVKNVIGDKLIEIQKKYSDSINDKNHFIKRGFLASEHVTKNRLLFIGLNPSWQNDKRNKVLNDEVNYVIEVSDVDNEYRKYFLRFEQLSKDIEIGWTHFDLLFCRETNHKSIKKVWESKSKSQIVEKEFITAQLNESKKIIRDCNPKIIIVANAFASQLFMQQFAINIDTDFDDDLGTYRCKQLADTPVFFSGMLSGGRTDNGSLKRLMWHIQFVLKKLADGN